MAEILIFAFLGHLVGDYLLQSKEMALKKSVKGKWGLLMCTLHVTLYTVVVTGLIILAPGTISISIWFILSVFIPHWLIDRFSFASWWLQLIRGRTFKKAYESKDQYREFDIAFTAIVYTVVDNTIHLLCLVAAVYFLLYY